MSKPENLTWKKLAVELSVTPRSLRDWHEKFADAPPDRDAAKWRAFMQERGLACYSGRRNAPMIPATAQTAPAASLADADCIDERTLRLAERRQTLALAEFKLAREKGEALPLTEYQAALRVTVGAFDAALKQIAGRAAGKVVQRARLAFVAMLSAELTAKQFEKIAPLLESAPVDHAAIVEILDAEIEACRRVLAEADFMAPAPAEV